MDSIPYLAILIAFVLIHAPRLVVGQEMKRLAGGYDHSNPRDQQTKLEGLGRRALAAHNNGFEAFAPFAAGVIAATARSGYPQLIAILASAFVVLRIVYIGAYLKNQPALRSGAWSLGMACTGVLLVLAVIGGR